MGNYMDYLSAKQVAELLGVCKNSVYNYIQKGELLAYQVGGKYRIPREAVAEFIKVK